jgi:acylphosphatase
LSERCVRATISGTVQGVGFRWFTQRELGVLGVVGTVKNLPDGRVEAVVAGSKELVERALGVLHQGPPGAHVTAVEVEELPAQGASGFVIVT